MVANFEGVINATTLTCNVTNEGIQISTFWSIANFGGIVSRRPLGLADPDDESFIVSGDPRPERTSTFRNRITIRNWTSAVDGVTLFCGTGSVPDQTQVLLRIYSE